MPTMPKPQQPGRPPAQGLLDQRNQRQRPAFPLIVGPHDQDDIFDADDQDQRPEQQRDDAHDIFAHKPVFACGPQRFPHGVKRACSDITVDDPNAAKHQNGQLSRVTP
jgi:hypothetical protein